MIGSHWSTVHVVASSGCGLEMRTIIQGVYIIASCLLPALVTVFGPKNTDPVGCIDGLSCPLAFAESVDGRLEENQEIESEKRYLFSELPPHWVNESPKVECNSLSKTTVPARGLLHVVSSGVPCNLPSPELLQASRWWGLSALTTSMVLNYPLLVFLNPAYPFVDSTCNKLSSLIIELWECANCFMLSPWLIKEHKKSCGLNMKSREMMSFRGYIKEERKRESSVMRRASGVDGDRFRETGLYM